MVENLYNERILELAATLSKVGRLKNAEFSSEAVSRLCGSKVTVDNLKVVKVKRESNQIFLKGAVPGAKDGIVTISK